MESQNKRLLKYLRLRKSVGPIEALNQLGIFRLAARVRDLREQGHDIRTTMVDVENRWGETTRVARYSL